MSETHYNIIDRASIWLSDHMDRVNVQNVVRLSIRRTVTLITNTVIAICAVIVSWAAIPSMETYFFGVVQEWRIDDVHIAEDGNWEFNIYGIKPWYRANCIYLPERASVVVYAENMPAKEGRLEYQDDETPGSTRPALPYEQMFGRAELVMPKGTAVAAGSSIVGSVWHDCHLPWDTLTSWGPFTLEESKPIRATVK